MAYTDFTIDSVADDLGLNIVKVDLFPNLEPLPILPWFRESLERGGQQVLISEKARSEFIVTPILLACAEMIPAEVAIHSGQRLDVDPARGLVGECDFILSATPPLPGFRAPLVAIVEAKKHDIEAGIWQCFAQMVGARFYNERSGRPVDEIFECVINAESWQFLRLAADRGQIDRRRRYLDDVRSILAAFATILRRHMATSQLSQ